MLLKEFCFVLEKERNTPKPVHSPVCLLLLLLLFIYLFILFIYLVYLFFPLQVQVTRGANKGQQGKVIAVYRKKWVIHIERMQREKANGMVAQIGFNPSKVREKKKEEEEEEEEKEGKKKQRKDLNQLE